MMGRGINANKTVAVIGGCLRVVHIFNPCILLIKKSCVFSWDNCGRQCELTVKYERVISGIYSIGLDSIGCVHIDLQV